MQAALSSDPAGHRDDLRAAATAAVGDGALLDDPSEWTAFGRLLEGDPATGLWESQVVVSGMHCAACAFTVEAALEQVPGVRKVEVNAASRRARIVWSSSVV